jgi:hypothetical protein
MYACMILMNKEWKKQFRADPSQRMYTGSTTSSRETIGVGDVATTFACCVLRVARVVSITDICATVPLKAMLKAITSSKVLMTASSGTYICTSAQVGV